MKDATIVFKTLNGELLTYVVDLATLNRLTQSIAYVQSTAAASEKLNLPTREGFKLTLTINYYIGVSLIDVFDNKGKALTSHDAKLHLVHFVNIGS